MASFIYSSFLDDVFRGNIDLDTNTFKFMLVTSSYTPNQVLHDRRDDITNEVTGTGYTTGGATCTLTVTKDTTNKKQILTVGSVNWPTSTITARRGVLYRSRGGASSADELVLLNDFEANIVTTAQTFVVAVSTYEISYAAG